MNDDTKNNDEASVAALEAEAVKEVPHKEDLEVEAEGGANPEVTAEVKEEAMEEVVSTLKPEITYDDFVKLDIRIGHVKEAVKVPETDKLYQCTVDFGEELGERTIISGLAELVEVENFVGGMYPYVVNLAPRMIKGIESQGMIMAAGGRDGNSFSLLKTEGLKPGTPVS